MHRFMHKDDINTLEILGSNENGTDGDTYSPNRQAYDNEDENSGG